MCDFEGLAMTLPPDAATFEESRACVEARMFHGKCEGAPTFASTRTTFHTVNKDIQVQLTIPEMALFHQFRGFVSARMVDLLQPILRRAIPIPILGLLFEFLAPTINWITGSGTSIDSRIALLSHQSMSPVVVSFRPTAAAISPE